jgi:hypothetical protein
VVLEAVAPEPDAAGSAAAARTVHLAPAASVECELPTRSSMRRARVHALPLGGEAGGSASGSTVLEIELLPVPAEGRPQTWTGLVGDYSTQLRAEPSPIPGAHTRIELQIEGRGNLDAVGALPLRAPEGWAIVRQDRMVESGGGTECVDYRRDPGAPGLFPAQSLALFDTRSGAFRWLGTPAVDTGEVEATSVPLASPGLLAWILLPFGFVLGAAFTGFIVSQRRTQHLGERRAAGKGKSASDGGTVGAEGGDWLDELAALLGTTAAILTSQGPRAALHAAGIEGDLARAVETLLDAYEAERFADSAEQSRVDPDPILERLRQRQ